LKAPLGTLISGEPYEIAEQLVDIINRERPRKVLAVGDTVTSTMVKHGINADVYIVDNRIMREKVKPTSIKGVNRVYVRNPSGTITSEAWKAIKEVAGAPSRTKIIVDGEEDLLVLPAVMFAPQGSLVLYGQPHRGVVLVRVTKEKKDEIGKLIRAMSQYKSRDDGDEKGIRNL